MNLKIIHNERTFYMNTSRRLIFSVISLSLSTLMMFCACSKQNVINSDSSQLTSYTSNKSTDPTVSQNNSVVTTTGGVSSDETVNTNSEVSSSALTATSSIASATTSSAVSSSSDGFKKTGISNPYVVNTDYFTDRVIVAEVNATWNAFGADPTGKKDSTSAIQSAINYCGDTLGGGTVYLPAGKYLMSGCIIIKTGVTLIGDYVDPDKVKGTDYGTMIYVRTSMRFKNTQPAVSMQGDAGIDGLTFYYPDQKADSPIDYYYTIVGQTASYRTIKNVTLLNSYCGVTSPLSGSTGMNTIDNLKGTILKEGLNIYSDADISYYNNITFSPKYWANMNSSFNPPTEAAIRSAMRSLNSKGVQVCNTDRDGFRNISIDGCKYGFYSVKPDRTAWNGNLFNVTIKNADYGIYSLGSCAAYGTNISQSSISGSVYSVYNASASGGAVNLYNVTLNGFTSGKVVKLSGTSTAFTEYSKVIPKPASNKIFNVVSDYKADRTGTTDSTSAIQNALDAANANGGGIVYLPAGRYIVKGSLTVGKGTMLLGSAYYNLVSNTRGSIVFAYSNTKELITLSGQKSGVVGITVVYPENGITNAQYTKEPAVYPYTVKCTASNIYVKNLGLIATSRGVLFENADNFIVDRIAMTAWHTGIKVVNSDNGYIHGVHTNATHAISFAGDKLCTDWINSAKTINGTSVATAYVMLDYNICKTLHLFKFENSKNIQLIENFHYGALKFALLSSGSSVFFINVEGSRIIHSGGVMFTLSGQSTLKGANAICYANQPAFSVESGSKVTIGNMDVAGKTNTYTTY